MSQKIKRQFAIIFLASTFMVAPVHAHWAQNSIDRFVQMDIVQGYEGDYRPNDFITRGEFAVLINRVLQYEATAKNTYEDLPDTWYTQDMLKMAQAGILIGDGSYLRPTEPITREEATVVMSRAFFLENQGEGIPFKDEQHISQWAVEAVHAMKSKGYLNGRINGEFDPKTPITRGEMIKILDQVVTKIYEEDGIYTEDIEGNLIISAKKVELDKGSVTGNIIVGESTQHIELKNVKIDGKVVICGGKVKIQGDVPYLLIQGEAQVEIEKGNVGYLEVVPAAGKSQIILSKNAHITEKNIPKDCSITVIKPSEGSTGGSGSIGGSGSTGGSGNTGDNNQQKAYTYTLNESFLMAPTWKLTLFEEGKKVKNYVLYAQDKKIAYDQNGDGIVVIPKGYSQYKLLVMLENETEYREITLEKARDML